MIFFRRSRHKLSPSAEKRTAEQEHTIAMTGRHDYQQLFRCDAALKIWLPPSIDKMLCEISRFQNTTVADFIRQVLFVHLYGRYDFLGYVERNLHYFYDPGAVLDAVEYSLTTDDDCHSTGRFSFFGKKKQSPPPPPPPSQEKREAALRIPIPSKMKNDLVTMAEQDYLPVSELARRIISIHLLGYQATFEALPAGIQEGVE